MIKEVVNNKITENLATVHQSIALNKKVELYTKTRVVFIYIYKRKG